MVTTPNQQDGAPAGSTPQQQEQQPNSVVNSTQENHNSQADSSPEVMPPLTHPAPLPNEQVQSYCNENLKKPPPRLMIKIYKVPVGAVVSWHALLTPNHEEIAKYQLYTYQESTLPPSTSLWKKLGDIDPLPLPMACTLTQFSAGCTYHFAIRAVDVHGRTGLFSESLSMFMEEDKIADELKMKNDEDKVKKEEESAGKVKEESMEETEGVEERDRDGAQVNAVEDNSAVQVKEEKDIDSIQVKEPEKAIGPVKEQEKAIVQDKEMVQVKEQEKGKIQVKEQDKELVQVKEEKERSPCSC